MNIDLQSQLTFGDKQSMLIFLGDHAFAHDTIADTIADADYPTVKFPLVEIGNIADWIQYHAAEHDSINTALNIGSPPDLRDVNFDDEQQFYDWMLNHRLLHDVINSTLGI